MRQVIAMGGGGFSMEPNNQALDRYILAQAPRANPAVCFLPTASGDADAYVVKFYAAFTGLECRPCHLPLFGRTPSDVGAFLLDQDVIYVGGGNTRSMLAVWREWGLDSALRAAWEQGVVLAGLSAGAICWFEQGVTDSVAGRLEPLAGLGLLEGSCCPHYDGEADRRPAYQKMVAEGQIAPGYGLDDGTALHFVGTKIRAVLASRPTARAYRVAPGAGHVQEQTLEALTLNST